MPFVLRRAALTVPALAGVSLVAFLIVHWMPGDPAEILAGEHASPEVVEQLRRDMRLDRPLAEQYLFYVADVLRGDLGRSAKTHEPVSAEIRDLTAVSSIASVPFHIGVHASPSAITNARLYAAADPASSRSETSVAFTYGA